MLITCHVAFASLTDYPKKQTMWLLFDKAARSGWRGEGEGTQGVYALCEYVPNYYGAIARARTEDNAMCSYRERQQDNSISASCACSPGIPHPHTHAHIRTPCCVILNFLLWLYVCECVWRRANKRWRAAWLPCRSSVYPLSALRLTASMCACLCMFGRADVWVWKVVAGRGEGGVGVLPNDG